MCVHSFNSAFKLHPSLRSRNTPKVMKSRIISHYAWFLNILWEVISVSHQLHLSGRPVPVACCSMHTLMFPKPRRRQPKHAENARIGLIFGPILTQFVKNDPHNALQTTGSPFFTQAIWLYGLRVGFISAHICSTYPIDAAEINKIKWLMCY